MGLAFLRSHTYLSTKLFSLTLSTLLLSYSLLSSTLLLSTLSTILLSQKYFWTILPLLYMVLLTPLRCLSSPFSLSLVSYGYAQKN